ncbi:hypothetical protein KA005_40640 [bacterium]|nr:hypothetical protein [bacterium]
MGYDVRLDRPGLPLFLQVKLSDCMIRNNAKEIRDGMFPRNSIFYRMHLRNRTSSTQHHLLLSLEDKGEEVYYVAPAFHNPDELTIHYLDRTISRNSIYVRPSFDGSKGRIQDNSQHHLSFMLEGPWFFYSKPEEMKVKFTFEEFSKRIEKTLQRIGETPLSEKMEELPKKLIKIMEEVVRPRLSFFQKSKLRLIIEKLIKASDQRDKAQIVSYISNTFLNCQFIVVQKQ